MELIITEDQLKKLTASLREDEDPVAATAASDAQPTTGASDEQTGTQGYPEVTTWASLNKITRGPDNQIANTKWSETVGSTLNRDVANQLKEQGNFPLRQFVNTDPASKALEPMGEFLVKNRSLIAQIGLGIIAAVATGGASLWMQALAQAGAQLPFSIYESIVEKDHYGAALSLAIACIPIAGRLGKIGTTIDFAALRKMAPVLTTLQTPDEVAKYLARVSTTRGGVALKQFLNVAPKEIEKLTSSAFVQGVKQNRELLPKIPIKQRYWLKDLGFNVGGAVGLAGLGQAYVKPAIEKSAIANSDMASQVAKSSQRAPTTPERAKEIAAWNARK